MGVAAHAEVLLFGLTSFFCLCDSRRILPCGAVERSALQHTTTMAEHHTQGRQGQGARYRRGNYQGRHRRHRMPRPEEKPVSKPSLLTRVLRFLGIGKKEEAARREKKGGKTRENRNNAPQKVRIARTNNRGGNPAASGGRRRPASTPPTRKARLYVGNLSYEATESELEDLFKGFGNVRSVEVIYNPRTYRSKGYAFVEMYQLEDARRAAEVLHGQPFMGRELMVSAASEKAEQPEEPTAQESAETTEAQEGSAAPESPTESGDERRES